MDDRGIGRVGRDEERGERGRESALREAVGSGRISSRKPRRKSGDNDVKTRRSLFDTSDVRSKHVVGGLTCRSKENDSVRKHQFETKNNDQKQILNRDGSGGGGGGGHGASGDGVLGSALRNVAPAKAKAALDERGSNYCFLPNNINRPEKMANEPSAMEVFNLDHHQYLSSNVTERM